MNNRAIGRLCHRKPSRAPTSTSRNPPTNSCGPPEFEAGDVSKTAARIVDAIAAMPDDKPSMLSNMLNELINPTIQSTDSVQVRIGTSRKMVNRQPCQMTHAAAIRN